MAWGFYKKVVVADWLAIFVNQVYNHPSSYPGLPSLLATYFFAFQIYCDFSGYSDFAIGAAQVMGYRLMLNFNHPYFAKSIGEFWKRWHISLSTWFRDYLYIPLGGNRVSRWRWRLNIFLTFLISGLWHGANWTFIVWGALHSAYMLISDWLKTVRAKVQALVGLNRFPRLLRFIQVVITFHLVLYSWIFFRAQSLSDAFMIIGNLFTHFDVNALFAISGFGRQRFEFALMSILILVGVELIQRRVDIREWLNARPAAVRCAVYYGLVMIILLFGAYDNARAFIYFHF